MLIFTGDRSYTVSHIAARNKNEKSSIVTVLFIIIPITYESEFIVMKILRIY